MDFKGSSAVGMVISNSQKIQTWVEEKLIWWKRVSVERYEKVRGVQRQE